MKDDSWKHNGSNDYMNKFLVSHRGYKYFTQVQRHKYKYKV